MASKQPSDGCEKRIRPHSFDALLRELIRPAERYIDVGAGIRPCTVHPGEYLRIEPFKAYADVLRDAGHAVLQKEAPEALERKRTGTVLMLDVLEHMERDDGLRALSLAQAAAECQVVVFTPNGFRPQEGDAWRMGGEYWQRHRSGWTPEDFPGWQVRTNYGNTTGLLAIWTR